MSVSSCLKFIPNRGQLSDQNGEAMPEVLYTLDGYGVKTYFTKGSMHYVFSKHTETSSSRTPTFLRRSGIANDVGMVDRDTLSLYRVDVKFIGSNPDPEITASDSTDDYTNYYLTNCPNGVTHVSGFRKIVYRNIYAHIDLVFYTNAASDAIKPGSDFLEYDFIVHPGGDPNAIRMSYDHATSLSVDETGAFHLATPYGKVTETKPEGYQLGTESQAGSTAPRDGVQCGFTLTGNNINFETGDYDRKRDLYIDPQRLWGTYYGWANSNNNAQATDLAVDRSGNVDVLGYTNGTANIATTGSYQATYGGGSFDCFIAKFGLGGNLLWATYYGGNGDEYSSAITCDTSRGIVITGNTTSTNAIASSGAFLSTLKGFKDAFLASFDSTGVRRWSTYFSGHGFGFGGLTPPSTTLGTGVAIDSASNIVLGGQTTDTGAIATVGAYLASLAGLKSGFIAKFTPQGSRIWSTYFGGYNSVDSDFTGATAVTVDAGNNIYIGGSTSSTTGIATTGAYKTSPGPAYLAKFTSAGAIVWATYYMDSALHNGLISVIYALAASRSGALYFAGIAQEPGLATPGAFQTSIAGDSDAILGKFTTNGKRVWVTYNGGTNTDGLYAMTLDTGENIFACGETASSSGIATAGEYQTTLLGPYNPYLVKFDSGGRRKWGTYYGRRGWGLGVGLDAIGHVFVDGTTETGTTEYASSGAYDGTPYGQDNAFLAKFCDPLEMHITTTTSDTVCPASSVSLMTKAGLSSYQWFLNGNAIQGATANPYTFVAPTTPFSYNYTVNGVGTDLCATISDTFQLVVRSVPQITVPQANNVCVGSSIKLLPTISGWNGYLKYAWTPAATLDHPDSLQPTATPTQPTTYTLSVTDSNGCVTTAKLLVSFYAQPNVSAGGNHTVCSGSPISITATTTGGFGPFTYLWSPAAGLDRADSSTVIVTVTKNTTYTVTVTDSHGCSSKDSLLLVVTLPPKISPGPPLSVCAGASIEIGTIITGGRQPYTVLWSPAAGLSDPTIAKPIATPSATTLYTITVVDKNGCSSIDSVLVTVSDSLTPTVTGGPLTLCTGDTAHLTAGSGYSSYLWSDGEKTSDISVTKTGDYTVYVTGGAGCAGTSSAVHITVLPDSVPHPVLTTTQTTICEGTAVTLKTTENYTSYLWSTGDTTPTISVSQTDTVTVTASNGNGCSGTSTPLIITVEPKPIATVTANGSDTLCGNDSLTLTAAGGYAKYEWSSGDATPSIVVKSTGIYSVTVTNAGGCSATSAPDTVTVNPIPELSIGGPAAVCPNSTVTYADSSNTRIAGDFFQWSLTPPGAGAISINSPSSITVQWGGTGTATLTLTEITPSGCSATAQFAVTISSNLTPIVTASGPIAFCPGDSVTLNAGAGYASYEWRMGGAPIAGATSETITINQSGVYTVFVTSGGGCSGVSQATNVVVYPPPTKPVITRNGTMLSSSSATEYQWYFNGALMLDSAKQTIAPSSDGSYIVTITDANGCQSTSDPYVFSTTRIFTANVSVRGGLGVPGDTILIPLMLDSGTNLSSNGAATYVARIGLDRAMLMPLIPTGVLVGNTWIVALTGAVPNVPGVLQSISALALDSGLCSDITIDTFYFPGAAIGVTTVSGTFCDTGTCAPLIISSDTAFTIKKVYPNPSGSSFTIEYHIAADGPLSITMEDYLGRNVCTLKQEWMKAGDENETYSAQAISSGVYRLVIRSGARAISTTLVVSK